MKEFYLDQHSITCRCRNDKSIFNHYCQVNPDRFLFFLKTHFILITYHSCMDMGDQYAFKKDLIDRVIVDNKVFNYFELDRGVDVENTLKNFRIRNRTLKKYIQQVNFIYYDNAKKIYAITTKTKFLDAIFNQDEIDKNYKLAKDFLLKNEYNWLLNQLDLLYYNNQIYNESSAEYCKSVDHIIKKINQLTK